MNVDVVIVGGGPTGLCFARALATKGLTVKIVEKQSRQALSDPAFDGREIAMTHASRQILEQLGVWQRIDDAEISPLRDARVLDGLSPHAMMITASHGGQEQLGYLIANHLIRRAAYEAVMETGAELLDETHITSLQQHDAHVSLQLSDGEQLDTRLLVACDSRFSDTRRRMGIGAQMYDFGKSMLVCRVAHEEPHDQTAWEWFDYGQTLALLPLKGNTASAILTLPQQQAQDMFNLDESAFAENLANRYHGRLGKLELISTRHLYPLVGVYSHRFIGRRFALIGDAAVGMHPVTAHGFNFGLYSVRRLAQLINNHAAVNGDIGSPALLRRYECGHRRDTLPLYLSTCTVATLFTNDRPPARLLRRAALRISDQITPFKRFIASHLTQAI